MIKSLILLASIMMVMTQPSIGGNEAPKADLPEEELRLPVHAEVFIFAGTSKIAKCRLHIGEIKRAIETLDEMNSDLDVCADSHRGIFLKECSLDENKKSDTANIFTKVVGGHIIPYRYLDNILERVSDPLLGFSFRSNFNKGEEKYQTEISVTFGICNDDLGNDEYNEVINMLEVLISERKNILNEYKKKATEASYVFVKNSQETDLFKSRKNSTEQEIVSLSNQIEDFLSDCEKCREDEKSAKAAFDEAEKEYARILNEKKELDNKLLGLLSQRAYWENLQIKGQTQVSSIEAEKNECADEANKIRQNMNTMNWYHGAVNYNGCFRDDGSMDCGCISRYRP